MKTIVLKMLPVLMSVFCTLHAVDKDCAVSENQKIYVDLSQINVVPEGIFVQLGNDWKTIDAIYHDASGYFFTGPSEWSFIWTCPNCGEENAIFRTECKNCGYKEHN